MTKSAYHKKECVFPKAKDHKLPAAPKAKQLDVVAIREEFLTSTRTSWPTSHPSSGVIPEVLLCDIFKVKQA